MTEHITDREIKKYAAAPLELDENEREAITVHLAGCHLCREHFQKLQTYFSEIENELNTLPSADDERFAEKMGEQQRILSPSRVLEEPKHAVKIFDAYAEIIEPYRRSMLQRFVEFARFHPVQFGGTMSFAFGLFAVLYFAVKPMPKDSNPSYARAKDEFLIAYNKEGQELWRKHIGYGYDLEKTLQDYPDNTIENYVTVADVNNDSKEDAIAVFGWNGFSPTKNTIRCYDESGKERWNYELHKNISSQTEKFSDDYVITQMTTGDFNHDGKIEIIAVARHRLYYPSAIIRLDAEKGILLNEYWNVGTVIQILNADIDGDGTEEILAGVANNSFNVPALIVLNPAAMNGRSPATDAYSFSELPRGTEKMYILFPHSDLFPFSQSKRTIFQRLVLSSSGFIVGTTDFVESSDELLYYHFDSTFKCTEVSDSDPFVLLHRKLEKQGKLFRKLDNLYYEELRRGVQYWDGERFVPTPTKNRNRTTTFP
ncbi:MAG: VCBS repeat-containing protein [Ignavibacteriales bacterium]|nr:VCBS repeat-containing protein [Ignavibacteriales bacterium]